MNDALTVEKRGYWDRWRRKTSWFPMQLFFSCMGDIAHCRIRLCFMTLLVLCSITRSSWSINSIKCSEWKTTFSNSNVKGDIAHQGKNFQTESIISVIGDDIRIDSECQGCQITAYRMRHVLHEGSKYMSLYYSLSAVEKTWEPRFEPLLDPSQWPLYDGLDYVSDVAMRKMRKGRWKKKHFCNKMDDMKKGYDNNMYNSGDFDQIKNKVYCSFCHGEGHTVNRHKEWPKRNQRARGTVGRNHRSRATHIIDVTHE
jgi:hypothetical protein